ncbi:MAG: Nif3-like dinuclear metal center hexameric protein [Pseudomonadota bacterium]|nr:Nif3-like dinuclear metal center hexameric protein [Pseudomonadota bacterium]
MIQRQALLQYLDSLLEPGYFKDYCPNGLQVQGHERIQALVSGVTATQALIERAIELQADAIFVHHGYFWRGEDPSIVGMKYNRIKALLEHEISLFAYHLPLDAHPELGNNAQLASRLGLRVESGLDPLEKRPIGNLGRLLQPRDAEGFAATIESALGRPPLLVKGGDHPVSRVAWCTGGAQGYIDKAVAMGADTYISGEISEQTTHVARECGIHYFAVGHHASERYGAKAVGEHLAAKFDLNHEFVDIDNPA